MHEVIHQSIHFVDLSIAGILFLLAVGFVGGLVSGFIGSGGAFLLTPGMMSLGVPGNVAVASNMCHKFPKALVGAIKRYKYGQVDVKMGIILGISAEIGVQIGIVIQKFISDHWGAAGSDLYVSMALVLVLVTVGSFVLRDALRSKRLGDIEQMTDLAKRLQSLNLWPMINFRASGIRISFWLTAPIGFACGLLAATIAVGGFVGVPGMMYIIGMTSIMASATELVVAFVMGLGGTIVLAFHGMVDIRLTLIILAGSLFGVQLGAIGTTYVKSYMIKFVMSSIMLIVVFSRALAIPKSLKQLDVLSWSDGIITILNRISFAIMCFALLVGSYIILKAMIAGRRAERLTELSETTA